MGVYLLSRRSLVSGVSYDPLYELEDILLEVSGGTLLTSELRDVKRWVNQRGGLVRRSVDKAINRTVGFYQPIDPLVLPKEPNVLLIVGLSGADLNLLNAIPQWRQRFDVVAAYVFDAWAPEIYPKHTRYLDHLFVPMPEIVGMLRQAFGIPVSLLPFGADALGQGSGAIDRSIDLASYGRIPKPHHLAFSKVFNNPDSDRLYFRSQPRKGKEPLDNLFEWDTDREDAMQLYHVLRRTKIALAYDTLYPGMRQFPHSFVTLRWFQCGAAGCAIAGKRPTTPLADELMDWEDSTIELPDDAKGSVAVIESLLRDPDRLNAIHRRNHLENLKRHDWRFRIRDVFTELGLPLPQPLVAQLAALTARHQQLVGMPQLSGSGVRG